MTTQPGRSAEEEFQPVTEEQLAEQLAYYSSRAGEYDDWWLRRGSFDKGEAANEVWFREAELVRSVLHSVELGDHVLELAQNPEYELLENRECAVLSDSSQAVRLQHSAQSAS